MSKLDSYSSRSHLFWNCPYTTYKISLAKLVEGLVPAINHYEFLVKSKTKCKIKPKRFDNFIVHYIGIFKVQFMLTFVVCFDSLVIRVALCKSVIADNISLVHAILQHTKIASKNVFTDKISYNYKYDIHLK
jgi:hypothetical protein